MNKARLQGLSAGIIFTTTIFAAFYYGTGKFEGTTPTAEEAKELLVKEGFVITLPTEEAKKTVQPKDPDKVLMEKEAEEAPSIVTYTIKVKTNMTTAEIADRLSKEKIIEDAAEFEAYMNDRDFSKRVQIGEFVVTNNMTYRQLANTLTH
ncbi:MULTISPECIES: endolytic transglycosylase MltG [unclassified Bacillus (in: firmicutes)]|uniref:endolytic transglycosylase MltG n=1 Tax=unclassified Bacillus (in: firmicutes) TaxID=185979 RepID=UPI001BE5CEA4|nr:MULTISPECIES: endolytic transglycosylase MltG [unclassified Bacillus (in: firmicutes)]MBT2618092.1 endolytic transglycosylase MltG [Bacillus sp. ISL-78]MBT2629614.1 endolytic transglycosylase MltG [Bacillus sp. ISL-101]MBT2718826.1 endolytic transglycosylase MltG [Bacillus sp. ISL-57]